jgi:two-component system chemotaxis response regulator CheY
LRYDLLTFLIADDNEHMRMIVCEILRAIGVRRIYEAGDGAQGLQALRTHPVDIVMTDLSMTPLDGIDFVRLIRKSADSATQMVPVIMITGHSTLTRVHEARDAGVNEFLTKPITGRGVIERIGLVINHPRPFIRSPTYFGPDRRRHADARWQGPMRRAGDERPGQKAAVREI